jgi:sterol desaturase/sphingolipid hydroxylase (fatty acid hydroxylase superfamily)
MPPLESYSLAELWFCTFGVVTAVSLLSTGFGVAFERLLAKRTRIWSLPVPRTQGRHEGLAYLRFNLLLATCALPFLSFGWIRFGAEGPAAIALTFMAIWTGFEVYYYILHRSLHSHLLYRFHAYHHESRVTTAWTGQSLSVVESLGWIAGLLVLPSLLSLWAPISWAGFLVYFAANTFVNLAGHANFEMNPVSARGATWLVHPWLYHALHHARFKNHYSFASTFMDRLFGTEWQDWPELHGRVVAGEPLGQFEERGAAER